ncbi:hypothetical protein BC628DRAFT_483020 [Trametes gibbosa]|nr:hypothetical protein BC628DRAFT_483020 [Trametes gibbosa]
MPPLAGGTDGCWGSTFKVGLTCGWRGKRSWVHGSHLHDGGWTNLVYGAPCSFSAAVGRCFAVACYHYVQNVADHSRARYLGQRWLPSSCQCKQRPQYRSPRTPVTLSRTHTISAAGTSTNSEGRAHNGPPFNFQTSTHDGISAYADRSSMGLEVVCMYITTTAGRGAKTRVACARDTPRSRSDERGSHGV